MPIDMSLAANAPPKRTRASSPTVPRKAVTDTRSEAVNGLFQLASFGSVMVGNYADSATIAEHGPAVSREIVALGQQNERIGQWIDYLNQAGPYAGLITALLPMTLQLLANHKRIDHNKVPGLTDPAVLEMRVETQMKAAAFQQMKQAQQEQAQYDQALAQMEASMQNGQPQQ
jgi:hypothetical protein